MTPEMIMAIASTAGVVGAIVGLVITWRKNGKSQATRDQAEGERMAARDAVTASNQHAIIQRLDDKQTGLQAVNIKVDEMKQYTAVLAERVAGHDREIRDMKKS